MFYTVKNKKVLLGLLIIVCVSLLLNNLSFVKAAEDDDMDKIIKLSVKDD